jgi:hypothetical protein
VTEGDDSKRLRVPLRVHHVSATTRLRRVLVPASPLAGTHLTALLWQHAGALFTSRGEVVRLGALFRLAAVSPHSAVFLPLRDDPPPAGSFAESWGSQSGLADLVVHRQDVPLRPSAWPSVRGRLRRGVPHTALAPAPRELHATGCRVPDRLTVAEHAGTVLLTGAAADLLRAGDDLTACADFSVVNPAVRPAAGPVVMSQFRGPDVGHRSDLRRDTSWECDILVEDDVAARLTAARSGALP